IENPPTDDPDPENPANQKSSKAVTFHWQREPHLETLTLEVNQQPSLPIPNSHGLELRLVNREIPSDRFPPNTRAISVFVINARQPSLDKRDVDYAFQVKLQLDCHAGFIPRRDPRGIGLDNPLDLDEAIAALQYRHDYEFAVGHNVSATATVDPNHPDICRTIATTWIPSAEVPLVAPTDLPTVELGMETLAAFTTGADLQAALEPLPIAYSDWIATQRQTNLTTTEQHTNQTLMDRAQQASDRIAAGIAILSDPQVKMAFQLANRVIAKARRQQLSQERQQPPDSFKAPQWRPFQLAFIVLNLTGMVKPELAGEGCDRDWVDLLFFPTGGGKTEAYLGLAAFTLVYRRLTHPGIQSAGVSVLMRYTLRLLTLDQLERATRLICALELEREQNPKLLGDWPFEIGLWVGQGATPNRMGKEGDKNEKSARQLTLNYKRGKTKKAPIPLENCPWCGETFTKDSFWLVPNESVPTNLQVRCHNFDCEFSEDHRHLPVIAVDDPLYRRLPCFIIATVDKFAGLPWFGRTAALFGKVSHFQSQQGFFGPADSRRDDDVAVHQGQRLETQLPPPDLIIQDELHLISGPLGTMVGLYETAIDALCTDENGRRPKIIASTATVRRAEQQVRALFARANVQIFPPPGADRHDSFFAKTIFPHELPGRLYVSIAAQGRSLKVILLRTYLTLLSAAQHQWKAAGGTKTSPNPADPYMTLLGYFNSLRELGGSRRIIEDEVTSGLQKYDERLRQNETPCFFASRKIDDDPQELTSRVSTNEVAETKRRLAQSFDQKDHVDVALATNMISVGLDIVRLGLMVVLGQPKTAAEYIQTTSRVGRDRDRPGLVVTLLNLHRPRDRSHYERFVSWHGSFYRAVEATSVTPFSARALDRGLAAVTVALARLGVTAMTPPAGASGIQTHRAAIEAQLQTIIDRVAHHAELSTEECDRLCDGVQAQVTDLLDTWETIYQQDSLLQYNKSEMDLFSPLLLDPHNPDTAEAATERQKFTTPRSLRDVEPIAHLWVRDPYGQDP
ncbi:DISARM system helicase DrmA, partial [Spirulina major CS-329]|uniref:DISARM system helicase DrmA n=1 Tax=Spirulina major TaxID=270636 RepID=UPI00232CE424